jgi:hypothetical protein
MPDTDRSSRIVVGVGEDLGPQVTANAELVIAAGLDVRRRWRVIVGLRPRVDLGAGELATRDLHPDDVAALIEGLELARAEAYRGIATDDLERIHARDRRPS